MQHAHMKESVHTESDSWMEEQHTHMGGRPNVGRVRVLVMNSNGGRAKDV
jgi:hypothetical protein